MTADRRNFLKVTATATLAGLAGCANTTEPSDTPAPKYTHWLYNPNTVLGFGQPFFATANLQDLRQTTNDFPPRVENTLTAYAPVVSDISLDTIDRMTLIGELTTGAQTGGSLVLEGDINTTAVEADIQNTYSEQSAETDTNNEYALYSATGDVTDYRLNGWWFGEGNSGQTISVGFGVTDDTVLASVVTHESIQAIDTIHAMIDSKNDNETHYYATSEAGQLIIDTLADTTVAVGGEFFATTLRQSMHDADADTAAVEELNAIGLGSTFENETGTATLVLAFATQDAASKDNTQTILEFIFDSETPDTEQLTVDGRVVTLSTDVQLSTLQKKYATFLWHQSTDTQSGRSLQENVPTVQFEYSQQSEGDYTIIHAGGDDFAATNVTVIYTDLNGSTLEKQWDGEEIVSAGDSVTTDTPVQPGSTIRVLWEFTESESHSTIGTYRVPE